MPIYTGGPPGFKRDGTHAAELRAGRTDWLIYAYEIGYGPWKPLCILNAYSEDYALVRAEKHLPKKAGEMRYATREARERDDWDKVKNIDEAVAAAA